MKQRRIFAGLGALTLAALILAFGARSMATQGATEGATEGGTRGTVMGKVVCRTCYMEDKTRTNIEHADAPESRHGGMPEDCARICSQNGMPLALLTKEGKLYTVTGKLAAPGKVWGVGLYHVLRDNEPNAVLVTHLTHTIIVGGVITEKNGVLEIAGDTMDWNMDNKDWRVGSEDITEHTKGEGLRAPREVPRGNPQERQSPAPPPR